MFRWMLNRLLRPFGATGTPPPTNIPPITRDLTNFQWSQQDLTDFVFTVRDLTDFE